MATRSKTIHQIEEDLLKLTGKIDQLVSGDDKPGSTSEQFSFAKLSLGSSCHPAVLVDSDANLTYFNDPALNKFGYTREEFGRLNLLDLLPNRDPHAWSDLWAEIRKRVTYIEDTVLRLANGERQGAELTINYLRFDEVEYAAVIVRDSLAPGSQDGDLWLNEYQYRNFVQKHEGIAFRTTLDYRPVFFHGALREITGFSEEEFIEGGIRWDQIIHPDDIDLFLERTDYLLRVPSSSAEIEYRIIRKDGVVRWLSEHIQSVCNVRGEPAYIQGFVYDITRQKEPEEDLRDSETKYQAMMETLRDPVHICNQDFLIEYMNPAMIERIGRDATGELCYEALHDKPDVCPWCTWDQIKLGKTQTREIVSPKDEKSYQITSSPIYRSNGSIAMLTIYRDVTDQKNTDKELSFLSSVVQQSTEGVAVTDLNGRIMFINRAWAEMHGYDPDESFEGGHISLFHSDESYSNEIVQLNHEAFEAGSKSEEVEHKRKDDSYFTALTTTTVLTDNRGRNFALATLARDITDRKKVERELRKLNEELEERVEERTAHLQEELEGRERIETALLDETEKIQSLLDNAGQGFLTFGIDLKVDVEYSEECRKLFNGEIWGSLFPDLVYPNNEEKREFLTSLLTDYFTETDPDRVCLFMSLLPSEVFINGKYIKVEYKPIVTPDNEREKRLLIVLTDVTEKHELLDQVEEEKNRLKMLVRAVTHYDELIDAVRGYESFCQSRVQRILEGEDTSDARIGELFRAIHTFKGTFSQLEMKNAVDKLHNLESRISEIRSKSANAIDDLKKVIADSRIGSWLDDDLRIVTGTLGHEFLNRKETLRVEPSQVVELEKQMISILSPAEMKLLLPKLRRMRCKSLKRMLSPFPEYLERLASAFGKSIYPLEIEGDDITVDPERYQQFVKTLVHVFRNIMDHGLENVDDRIEAGKDEQAKVRCCINSEDEHLVIEISDDGRGIDAQRLRKHAVRLGICDQATADSIPDSEIVTLIFDDSFSTAQSLTAMSGRGIGMSAVKRELDKLGGSVEIETEIGKGTRQIYRIPLEDSLEVPELMVDDIMKPLIIQAREYMTSELGLKITGGDGGRFSRSEKLAIKNTTAMIAIKGTLRGTFMLSFDEKLAQCVVSRFSMDELTEAEIESYAEDTVAEISNVILGQTISALQEGNDLLTIEPPVTIRTSSSHVKYTKSYIYTNNIETNEGSLSISFFSSDAL